MALSRKQKSHGLKVSRKWVNFKITAERPFKRELRTYFAAQTKRVKLGQDIEPIAYVLDGQYKRIVRNMTGIKLKQEDDKYNLEEKLLFLLSGRALKQGATIDNTTEKIMTRSIELARAELSSDGILFPSAATIGRIAANIFRGYTTGRVGNIAVTETQMLTEKLRNALTDVAHDMIEDAIITSDFDLAVQAADMADSFTFEQIADDIGEVPAGELIATSRVFNKSWVTMGDKKVRPWHDDAMWQTVPENEPFVVMGELLMFPGDMSLGASLKNVSQCRCNKVNM